MAMRMGKTARDPLRGFSLVELMVALTLGAILLGGAVTMFVNNRETYKINNELSRLQETARYALNMMVKDIRMAGYFGCADRLDTVANNTAAAADSLADSTYPIEGLDAAYYVDGFLPSGYTGLNGTAIADSDGITLRYLAGNMADVAPANGTLDFLVTADAINSTTTTPIDVDSTTGLAAGQVAAIFDCSRSDIFQITGTPTATRVQANALSRRYDTSSSPMIAPFVGVRYYVADNGRGPGGEVYPSLYRTVITPGALTESDQELFEGVERMHIIYGVDTNGDGVPESYVRAGDAPLSVGSTADWSNVVSVRVAIVVRTIDEHGRDDDENTYQVNDVSFDPVDDRRHRRVFTTTAMVRNLS